MKTRKKLIKKRFGEGFFFVIPPRGYARSAQAEPDNGGHHAPAGGEYDVESTMPAARPATEAYPMPEVMPMPEEESPNN